MWRLASNKTQFRSMVFWGLGAVLLTSTALVSAQEPSAGERYAKILADSESLARYNEQLTSQLDSQQSQVLLIEQQLTEIDATAAQVGPLIQKMFESLEAFLAADLPFLDPTQAGPDSPEPWRLRSGYAAPADGAQSRDCTMPIRDLMAELEERLASRMRNAIAGCSRRIKSNSIMAGRWFPTKGSLTMVGKRTLYVLVVYRCCIALRMVRRQDIGTPSRRNGSLPMNTTRLLRMRY